ncbi:MAG: ABC transporter substrate-binding protein, partial [Candidatus Heimdallarchaeaceae archaeon]
GTGELTPVGTAAAANGIRKAISHAVPRQTIVDEILEGLGAPGVIAMPDALVGFDESLQPYAYDLELAKTYMEAAGYSFTSGTITTGTTTTGTTTTGTTTTGTNTYTISLPYSIIIVCFLALACILLVVRKKRRIKP